MGQGVGNIVSGAFGGAAGAGATVRTGETSNLAKFLARSRSRYPPCLLPSLLLQSHIYVPKAEAVVGCAVVNVRAGGRTPLSGATHSAVLLCIVAGLGRFAQHIPQACLGGLLLKSGWEVLDLPYLARARQLPAESVFVMVRPPHAQACTPRSHTSMRNTRPAYDHLSWPAATFLQTCTSSPTVDAPHRPAELEVLPPSAQLRPLSETLR